MPPESDDAIRSLREALQVTPHNLPLRKLLAKSLVEKGRLDEAEQEYRRGLSDAPSDEELNLALAEVFQQQSKGDQALVVVEALVRAGGASGQAYLRYARLLFAQGQTEHAVHAYYQACERDDTIEDLALKAKLGIYDEQEETGLEEVVDGRLRAAEGPGETQGAFVPWEKPELNFEHVGGMDELKEQVSTKIILPLTHPELFEAYGKKAGGGILMYGPPGCGKTHLARATAGEVSASFLSVGIHDVLDMWIGESERKLHELFQEARRRNPSVLFFDEVDALGGSRSDMRGSAGRASINQFLAELDGVQSLNDGVLILGATNAPWHLDSAFRRPGRFDQVIFVPPPDHGARAAILQILLEGKPQEKIDVDAVAKKSADFSGADLKSVVDVAIEEKLKQAVREKKVSPLRTKDLLASAKKHKPTTKEWFATAKNYALYSNQGGIYDDILSYLEI